MIVSTWSNRDICGWSWSCDAKWKLSKVYLKGVFSRKDWLYVVTGAGECCKLTPVFNCWFLHSLVESLLECRVYFFYFNCSILIYGKLGGYF